MSPQEVVNELGKWLGVDLTFKGGGPIVLGIFLVIAILVVRVVWNASVKLVDNRIQPWLEKHDRFRLVVAFGLPSIVCLVAGRPGTAILLIVLGVIALMMQERQRGQIRASVLAGSIVVALLVSVPLEGAIWAWHQRKQDERFTVYVVLPFQGTKGEPQQTLVDLTVPLRDTVQRILGSLGDVSIHPESLTTADLKDWKDRADVVKRLRGDGVEPDILLVNTGNLSAAEYLTVRLRPSFPSKVPGDDSFDEKPVIMAVGLREDITYLAIRSTLELVQQIKSVPGRMVKPKAEADIVRKAAAEYLEQLQSDNRCPPKLLAEATAAVDARPPITLAALLALTKKYPPDQTAALSSRNQKAEALTSKFIPDQSPRIERAATATQPAAGPVTAPAATTRSAGAGT